uniref:Uncharacterized protein n=1 Tax=Arundo donax TaxID=35708 RepID=A0A0A9GZK9_ARUDO
MRCRHHPQQQNLPCHLCPSRDGGAASPNMDAPSLTQAPLFPQLHICSNLVFVSAKFGSTNVNLY